MKYIKIMFHQIENINKETKIIEKIKWKFCNWKNKEVNTASENGDTIICTIIYTLGGIERSRKNVGISNGPDFQNLMKKTLIYTYKNL